MRNGSSFLAELLKSTNLVLILTGFVVKLGRGTAGITPVLGILQRNRKVYTEIVLNFAKATLQAIIRGKDSPDIVIYSGGSSGANGLVDLV